MPTPREALDVKEACVQAAREAIAEHGLEKLSLRDVARRLGVSHQAPYKHYPSRDHLLAEVMRRCFQRFAADLDARLPERLGFVAEAFVRPWPTVGALAQQAQALLDAWPGATEANVVFLPAPLSAAQWAVLATLGSDDDRLLHEPALHGPQLFWLCRTRQSESKVSNTLLERKLKLRCTLRRHSMLQKMAQTLAP